jgi:hypothetical protein
MLIIYHPYTSTSTPSLQSSFCSSAFVGVHAEVWLHGFNIISTVEGQR